MRFLLLFSLSKLQVTAYGLYNRLPYSFCYSFCPFFRCILLCFSLAGVCGRHSEWVGQRRKSLEMRRGRYARGSGAHGWWGRGAARVKRQGTLGFPVLFSFWTSMGRFMFGPRFLFSFVFFCFFLLKMDCNNIWAWAKNGLLQLPLFAYFRVTRIEQRHQKGPFCLVLPSLNFLVLIFFK